MKTQLIYPGGNFQHLDGAPHRWRAIQGVLALAASHVSAIRGIEVVTRSSSYPVVHFLRPEAESELHERVIHDISMGLAHFLQPTDDLGFQKQRVNIRRILLDVHYDKSVMRETLTCFSNTEAAEKMLLVVRGLLMQRVLVLCLAKRWKFVKPFMSAPSDSSRMC